MLLVTTDTITGREFVMLSVVEGSVVQSAHFGKDFMSGLKTLIGGEITAYTEMMEEARAIAHRRMIECANKLGADAIVGLRYMTNSTMQGAAEVMAYGTAIKFTDGK